MQWLDSILLTGILRRNCVCQYQHPKNSWNWVMPSRGHAPSYLWLLLGDSLVALLISLLLTVIPSLYYPFGFREQTNPALNTFFRGQASGMNYKTSRWLTSFPRWSRCRKRTFRWVGHRLGSVLSRWVLGSVRGMVCVEAGSGIESEPWLGWVPVEIHWGVRFYGLESAGVIFREEKSREVWTIYEWAKRLCVWPGQFCRGVWSRFKEEEPGIIRTPARSWLWNLSQFSTQS